MPQCSWQKEAYAAFECYRQPSGEHVLVRTAQAAVGMSMLLSSKHAYMVATLPMANAYSPRDFAVSIRLMQPLTRACQPATRQGRHVHMHAGGSVHALYVYLQPF